MRPGMQDSYRKGYLDALRDVSVTLLQLKAGGQGSLDEILEHIQALLTKVEESQTNASSRSATRMTVE